MPEENDNDNAADENEEQHFTVENPSLDLEVTHKVFPQQYVDYKRIPARGVGWSA